MALPTNQGMGQETGRSLILRRASFFDPKAGYEAIGAQFRETPANKRIHLIYSLE